MNKQQKRFARNSEALEGAGLGRSVQGVVVDVAAEDGKTRVKREHWADAAQRVLWQWESQLRPHGRMALRAEIRACRRQA